MSKKYRKNTLKDQKMKLQKKLNFKSGTVNWLSPRSCKKMGGTSGSGTDSGL